jgi:hypothetical protein
LSFLATQPVLRVKKLIFFVFIVACFSSAQAQKISAANLRVLQKKEDSLKLYAKKIIVDSTTTERIVSDSLFIRVLVRSLQVPHSFYYPFDSVKGISSLYAPDSTFRIFTWSLSFDDYYSRQRGAIQFRTKDGSLRLVPLRDYSEFTTIPEDSFRTKDNWIGAVYYNMVKTEHRGKKYYTLFGIDYHSVRSNRKWVDVLTFDDRNMPVFGGTFSWEEDSVTRPDQQRYYIEYKKEAGTLFNFVEDEGLILIDHLVSESDEEENAWTLIPDGDYEGFKWKNGKWVHIEKVFNVKLKDGEFPMPDPFLDENGEQIKKAAPPDKKKKKG